MMDLRGDPLARLPNICIDILFEDFTTLELIYMRSVSNLWRGTLDWLLASRARRQGRGVDIDADDKQVSLDFRRALYRQEAFKRGEPSSVRRFTRAKWYVVCGGYFCWIDDRYLNVQLIFDPKAGSVTHPVRRHPLGRLLGATGLFVRTFEAQEPGCITDEPLLAIGFIGVQAAGVHDMYRNTPLYVAVISVKKGKTLWTASYGSVRDTASQGQQYALNGNTFAYISGKASSTGKKLCMRDVRTGKLREGELVRQKNSSQNPDLGLVVSIRAHPRRDLVYVITAQTIFFFSTTTANCIGRLRILQVRYGDHTYLTPSYPTNPLTLYFSESKPACDSSVREKFFACYSSRLFGSLRGACHEFEIPTVEEVAAAEAKPLGEEIPEKLSVFTPIRVQTYGVHDPRVNPFLKLSVNFIRSPWGNWTKDLHISPFMERPGDPLMLFDETSEKHESDIPMERYISRAGDPASKPEQGLPRGIRWGENRTECPFPASLNPIITTQERYILFPHKEDVYLLGFEPFW